MSDPDLVCRNLKEILERYYKAALTLANAKEEPVSPDGRLRLDELEGEGLEDMLRRQANSLLQMYDAGKAGCSGDSAAFTRIARRLKDVELASHARLYAYRFDQVPFRWRQIYSDAHILTTFHVLLVNLPWQRPFEQQRQGFLESLDEVIARLDRAIVTAGGGGRDGWIDVTMKMLHQTWEGIAEPGLQGEFSSREPFGRPTLTRPCVRHRGWDIDRFERYMEEGHALAVNTGAIGPVPIVFTDLIKDDWPALRQRTWFRPDHLFRQTTGGRRLVPVEIGRSYVDAGWGQELLPFKDFLVRFIDRTLTAGDAAAAAANTPAAAAARGQTGYLAQHNLFEQIPALRNDILVPDLCWASAPGQHPLTGAAKPKLPLPELNAWFGPPGTITPLHTDGYNNLLCQAVGAKYVRLYPPQADSHMRPMPRDEKGVDMSNTSAIDLGAIEGWDGDQDPDADARDDEETRKYIQEQRDSLEGVEYFECILEPGDTLLIPVGWWHCVRSLSVSFSVSFWWN